MSAHATSTKGPVSHDQALSHSGRISTGDMFEAACHTARMLLAVPYVSMEQLILNIDDWNDADVRNAPALIEFMGKKCGVHVIRFDMTFVGSARTSPVLTLYDRMAGDETRIAGKP